MGPTIASTSIGSAGQQSARMNNLLTGKVKEATSAGLDVANKVVRGMGKAGNIVKAGSIAAVATPPIAKKISTPVKKAVLGKPPKNKK
jgi:hypothetical protein